MRFTVTATSPQVGTVERFHVDAAHAGVVQRLVEAEGLVVQSVDLALWADDPPVAPGHVFSQVRAEARLAARRASIYAKIYGYTAGIVGVVGAVLLYRFHWYVSFLFAAFTVAPAVVVLVLSDLARRLRFWAVVALLAVAGLVAIGTGGLVVTTLSDEPEALVVAVVSLGILYLMGGTILSCVQTLRFFSRFRQGQTKGFTVEPAKSSGVGTME